MEINLAKVFNKKKKLLLGTIIVLSVVLIVLALGSTRPRKAAAEAQPTATQLTATPVPTLVAIAQPTTLLTPEPTPFPGIHYVAWSNAGPGVYYRDLPGGLALGVLPNGTEIEFATPDSDTAQRVKNIDWEQIQLDGQTAWVASHLIFRMRGEYRQVDEPGRWLFDVPDGRPAQRLWAGTPYTVDHIEDAWCAIVLPDGELGWFKLEWFQPGC